MLKKSIGIRIAGSAAAALIGSFIVPFILQEPAENRIYQRLLKMRSPVPELQEILLVETGGKATAAFLRKADFAETLMILTEMEAGRAVLEAPTEEGPAPEEPENDRGKAISRRFDDEFGLIEKNIRTLFEAIRLGSVRPRDSSRYIGDVIDLIGKGKERLLFEALNAEDAGAVFFDRARSVFGKVWTEEAPNRSRKNGGGKERRIRITVPGIENGGEASMNAAFAALLDRIGARSYEFHGNRLFIPGARLPGKDKGDLSIPIGPDGALMIEPPRNAGETPLFRRLSYNDLLQYKEMEKKLHQDFLRMERAGYFNGIRPENYPTILYENTLSNQEDLLVSPDISKKEHWRRSREEYFSAAREFLYGETETDLVSGYENLIIAETLDEAGAARIVQLRDTAARDFSRTRALFSELVSLRDRLDAALRGAFCIFSGDAEKSALLVNGIITGRYIENVSGRPYFFVSFLTGLALSAAAAFLGVLPALAAGFLGVVLFAAAASAAFLSFGLWIDPAGPLAVVFAVTLVSVLFRYCTISLQPLSPAARDTPTAGPPAGKPFPKEHPSREVLSAVAAIVAVRNGGNLPQGILRDRARRAREHRAFRERTGRQIIESGGVVIGVDGAVVLAAFGAPSGTEVSASAEVPSGTEVSASGDSPGGQPTTAQDLARLAGKAVLDMIGTDPSIDDGRRYGVDIGVCSFFYSEFGGYSAEGSPLVHARMLSGLAMKHRCRVLVTRRIKDAVGQGWGTRRFDTLTP
jgi:hypothetical protein